MASTLRCTEFQINKQEDETGGQLTIAGSVTLGDTTVSNIQSVLTDTDAAVPTSGAVADYVQEYAEPAWVVNTVVVSGSGNSITLADRNKYLVTYPDSLTISNEGFSGGAEAVLILNTSTTTVLSFSGTFNFSGDHCQGGSFFPQTNTKYIIRFYSNDNFGTSGNRLVIGVVSAVNTTDTTLLPLLLVTAPTGASVTCTDGTITLTGISDTGVCSFLIPSAGTWTVSGVYDSVPATSSVNVTINIAKTYTATLTFSGVKVYGVRHYKTLPSSILERLGDAIGKTFTRHGVTESPAGTFTTNQVGSSGFDTEEIYKDIKVCNILNGVVTHYEGDEGFSYSCEHGIQVVIADGTETGVRVVIAANGANFDVTTYYNGTQVGTTQTTSNAYGAGLTAVTCGTDGVINFYDMRTEPLVAGTYNLAGGTESANGGVTCGTETLCTASTVGTWSNNTAGGKSVTTYYNGIQVGASQSANTNGTNLEDVTCGTRSLEFNTSRTEALTTGTYSLAGGTDSVCGSVTCGTETLCTASVAGTWSNYVAEGDCVVAIPKYYIKIDDNNTTTTIWISNKRGHGFITSPGHANRGDGHGERDWLYLGRYHSSTDFQSVSGKTIRTEKTLAEFRTGHTNRGTGYGNMDFATYCTCVWLYLIETATLNSQVSLGMGFSRYNFLNQNKNSGATDRMSCHSGYIVLDGIGNSNSPNIQWRGIENIFGSFGTFLDGIKIIGGEIYLAQNPTQFSSDDSITGYERWCTVPYSGTGPIKSMYIDTSNARLVASDVSGSTQSYWSDQAEDPISQNTLVLSYGICKNGSVSPMGMFATLPVTLSQNSIYEASRLLILP